GQAAPADRRGLRRVRSTAVLAHGVRGARAERRLSERVPRVRPPRPPAHPRLALMARAFAVAPARAGANTARVGVRGDVPWLLTAIYAFAACFVRDGRIRRLAVALALGTLGLDTLAALARGLFGAVGIEAIANLLPDTINPYLEVSSFGALLSAPHLMLGLALTLLCAPIYLRAVAGQRVWLAVLAATVISLSLVHSFNTPVLVSVLLVHGAISGRYA